MEGKRKLSLTQAMSQTGPSSVQSSQTDGRSVHQSEKLVLVRHCQYTCVFIHARKSSRLPSFGRSVGLVLPAAVGAVLPSEVSLLTRQELLSADQQRGRSSPSPAFPSRGH